MLFKTGMQNITEKQRKESTTVKAVVAHTAEKHDMKRVEFRERGTA